MNDIKHDRRDKNMVSRRGFFTKFGATGGVVLGTMIKSKEARAQEFPACSAADATESSSLTVAGTDLNTEGFLDFGGDIGAPVERTAVATACWQCVARDGAVGYVEDGKLVKMEGNPKLLRTGGKLCAKGQGGVHQVYDPDRLLTPLIRPSIKAWLDSPSFPDGRPTSGRDQETEWTPISWSEAQKYVGKILKDILDNDEPEQFYFHYGRMKASSSAMIKRLLSAIGTKSVGNHTSICESCKWTGQELSWGKHYDVNDLDRANFIVNFGCNMFATHTSHIPLSQRGSRARARGVELHTFDPRLSETAAKSTKWYPLRPGTDLAVMLALCHEICNNHASKIAKDFINNWCYAGEFHGAEGADNVERITNWLNAEGYSPSWAAGLSGISAGDIQELAAKFMDNKPSSVLTYRGAVQHWNGVQAERAAMLLQALSGGINSEGGRVKPSGAKWSGSWKDPGGRTGLPISDGGADAYVEAELGTPAYLKPTHHASHSVLNMMEATGIYPRVYLSYCYAPIFANGDCNASRRTLRNRNKIEVVITCSTTFSETCELSDIVIPDATYLERWDWEDMVSYDQIPEWYIRQPVVDPIMGVRDFKDFFRDVCAEELGLQGKDGDGNDVPFWADAEAFVRDACEKTEAIAAVGGFEYMREHGAYYDPDATPKYNHHLDEIDGAELFTDGVLNAGVAFTPDDPALPSYSSEIEGLTEPDSTTPGVFWEWSPDPEADPPETEVPSYINENEYKHYIGRGTYGGTVYEGFGPDKIATTSMVDIYSPYLHHKVVDADWGSDPEVAARWVWPNWMDNPGADQANGPGGKVFLLTHKDRIHTHSRTQNCKVLSEFMHDNPAWMNAATATALGIEDGDEVILTNDNMRAPVRGDGADTESLHVKVRVTEGIHPDAISMAHHAGHWQHGRYATAGKVPAPEARDDDPDLDRIWWKDQGKRVNFLVPNWGDPIGGGLRFFDTVVKVTKA